MLRHRVLTICRYVGDVDSTFLASREVDVIEASRARDDLLQVLQSLKKLFRDGAVDEDADRLGILVLVRIGLLEFSKIELQLVIAVSERFLDVRFLPVMDFKEDNLCDSLTSLLDM